jgi:hypothetical protein
MAGKRESYPFGRHEYVDLVFESIDGPDEVSEGQLGEFLCMSDKRYQAVSWTMMAIDTGQKGAG